jgi:hypothetical protein
LFFEEEQVGEGADVVEDEVDPEGKESKTDKGGRIRDGGKSRKGKRKLRVY